MKSIWRGKNEEKNVFKVFAVGVQRKKMSKVFALVIKRKECGKVYPVGMQRKPTLMKYNTLEISLCREKKRTVGEE